jgi:hypothetical protein
MTLLMAVNYKVPRWRGGVAGCSYQVTGKSVLTSREVVRKDSHTDLSLCFLERGGLKL